jgi:hypothetical protein
MKAQQLRALATKSKTFCLDEHPTLFCVRFLPNPVPNPVQIQLRTFFGDYHDGGTFPYDLLKKYPQSRTARLPIYGEASLSIAYVYLLTWIIRLQQRTDVTGNVLRDRLNRFDHQPLDNFGLRPI